MDGEVKQLDWERRNLMARVERPPPGMSKKQFEEWKAEIRQREKERQELRCQPPGLDSLLGFFKAVPGIQVELGRGRWLWINGSQTEHLAHLPPPESLEWNSIVSDITLKHLPGTFMRAIADNARFDTGIHVALVPGEKGFAVMRGDTRLAVIHAARAQIPDREGMRANFLIPGEHWQLLAEVVRDTEADLVAEGQRHEEAKATAIAG